MWGLIQLDLHTNLRGLTQSVTSTFPHRLYSPPHSSVPATSLCLLFLRHSQAQPHLVALAQSFPSARCTVPWDTHMPCDLPFHLDVISWPPDLKSWDYQILVLKYHPLLKGSRTHWTDVFKCYYINQSKIMTVKTIIHNKPEVYDHLKLASV